VKILHQRFAFRFVFRHFPLFDVHPNAMLAAEAAEAAGAQGRFWQMHDRLFEQRRHLLLADLQRYAGDLELDMTRFDAEMADHVYVQRVQEHIAGGRASRVHATPTFFVDGVRVDTSFSLERLSDAIASHQG
jgi:protein-disulfide isomerase